MRAEAAARSAKRRPQAIEAAGQAGVESVSTQPGALDASTGLGDFGEDSIRPP